MVFVKRALQPKVKKLPFRQWRQNFAAFFIQAAKVCRPPYRFPVRRAIGSLRQIRHQRMQARQPIESFIRCSVRFSTEIPNFTRCSVDFEDLPEK
jgi:hypothetical protein